VPISLPTLVWLDWALLAVLAASVIVGLWRGFVFECLSLAGWVVAWFAAQWAAPQLAPQLSLGPQNSALNLAVALALCFVLALVIWGLLAKLVRLLIHATPLSIPDRILGAAFGALRAAVLGLAVASVVALTPAAQSKPWRASMGARWLTQSLVVLKPLLPAEAARWLKGAVAPRCSSTPDNFPDAYPCAASSAFSQSRPPTS
jgi:membrane protein required for colicin V production